MRCVKPLPAWFWYVLTLIVLAVLLTGCGATLPPVVEPSTPLPSLPSVSEPQPSQTYSKSASEAIQKWRDRLTATPLTP